MRVVCCTGPNRCDAEIIELDRPVTTVPPIPVWDNDALGSEEGHDIDVVGWGVTGDAATISERECNRGALTGDLMRGENRVLRVTEQGGGGLLEYMMKRPVR